MARVMQAIGSRKRRVRKHRRGPPVLLYAADPGVAPTPDANAPEGKIGLEKSMRKMLGEPPRIYPEAVISTPCLPPTCPEVVLRNLAPCGLARGASAEPVKEREAPEFAERSLLAFPAKSDGRSGQ